jgi:hypothetical protein
MTIRLLAATLTTLAGATCATHALASVDPATVGPGVSGEAGVDEGRVRAVVLAGFAIALGDYDTHGVAFPIRVGADLPMFRTGSLRHRLLLAVQYAHFSRAFITEPEVIPGARLDAASLGGTWRLFPFVRRGLHFDGGAALSLRRDRLQVALPSRHVSSSETRLALSLELGLGWTLGRYGEFGVRYAQDLPLGGGSSPVLNQLELSFGVRL